MSTTHLKALLLADAYAEASFDQGLKKRTLDDAPEKARSVLEAELLRLHADLAHADRYAEQLGRELAKAGAEIADLRAQLASIGGASPPEGMAAEQALRKVLAAVQRYLPPDGPSAKDTLTEIIEIVDPWPLGRLEKL